MHTRYAVSRLLNLPILLAALLLGTSLSACNLTPPDCLEMPAPFLISPGGDRSTTFLEPGTRIVYRWLYFGSCQPNEYRIMVSKIKSLPTDFGPELLVLDTKVPVSSPPVTIIYEDGTTAIALNWDSDESLPVGTYYWRVTPYSNGFYGERSDWRAFQVYSTCSSLDDYTLAPRLISPGDGRTVPGNEPSFLWVDDNTCSLTGTYTLQISEYPYFPPEATFDWSEINWLEWTRMWGGSVRLDFCTRYYWRVKVEFETGADGPISEAFSFNTTADDGSACTPAEPPPTPAASPALARPLEPANCRSGPSLEYPVLSILPAGGEYEIRATNTSGDSWMVYDPLIDNTCWVYGDLVEVLGDTSVVMTFDPEPPIPVLPVVCSDYGMDRSSCEKDSACWWNPIGGAGNGGCENK